MEKKKENGKIKSSEKGSFQVVLITTSNILNTSARKEKDLVLRAEHADECELLAGLEVADDLVHGGQPLGALHAVDRGDRVAPRRSGRKYL